MIADSPFIILQVGPIRGADLMQAGATFGHDIGDAKGTADFDQFPTGNDDFPTAGNRIQAQQHCPGIVIDRQGSLGAGQFAEQTFDRAVTRTAHAFGQVKLQVGIPGRDRADIVDNGIPEQGAAQVGMHHNTGGIDRSAQVGRHSADHGRLYGPYNRSHLQVRGRNFSVVIQNDLAQAFNHFPATVDQNGFGLVVEILILGGGFQNAVDPGQLTQQVLLVGVDSHNFYDSILSVSIHYSSQKHCWE